MPDTVIPYYFDVYCRIYINREEFECEEDYEEIKDEIIYQKISCTANLTEKHRNKFNDEDGLMCLASNALTGDWDGLFPNLKDTESIEILDDDIYGYFTSYGDFDIIQNYNLPESTDIEIVKWIS